MRKPRSAPKKATNTHHSFSNERFDDLRMRLQASIRIEVGSEDSPSLIIYPTILREPLQKFLNQRGITESPDPWLFSDSGPEVWCIISGARQSACKQMKAEFIESVRKWQPEELHKLDDALPAPLKRRREVKIVGSKLVIDMEPTVLANARQ